MGDTFDIDAPEAAGIRDLIYDPAEYDGFRPQPWEAPAEVTADPATGQPAPVTGTEAEHQYFPIDNLPDELPSYGDEEYVHDDGLAWDSSGVEPADYHDFRPGARDIDVFWSWVSAIDVATVERHTDYWRRVSSMLAGTSDLLRARRDALDGAWSGDAAAAFLERVGAARYSMDDWARAAANNAGMLDRVAQDVQFTKDTLGTVWSHYRSMLGQWQSWPDSPMVVYHPEAPGWQADFSRIVAPPELQEPGAAQGRPDLYPVTSADDIVGLYHNHAADAVRLLTENYVTNHFAIDQPREFQGSTGVTALGTPGADQPATGNGVPVPGRQPGSMPALPFGAGVETAPLPNGPGSDFSGLTARYAAGLAPAAGPGPGIAAGTGGLLAGMTAAPTLPAPVPAAPVGAPPLAGGAPPGPFPPLVPPGAATLGGGAVLPGSALLPGTRPAGTRPAGAPPAGAPPARSGGVPGAVRLGGAPPAAIPPGAGPPGGRVGGSSPARASLTPQGRPHLPGATAGRAPRMTPPPVGPAAVAPPASRQSGRAMPTLPRSVAAGLATPRPGPGAGPRLPGAIPRGVPVAAPRTGPAGQAPPLGRSTQPGPGGRSGRAGPATRTGPPADLRGSSAAGAGTTASGAGSRPPAPDRAATPAARRPARGRPHDPGTEPAPTGRIEPPEPPPPAHHGRPRLA